MSKFNNSFAVDIGASGGRAVIGKYNGKSVELAEIHRFSNDPVTAFGTMYWDSLRLFHEIKQGMLKAKTNGGFESIGVDTWGVDFGLVDKNGILLENPVHYRDKRTMGMLEESFNKISKEIFYDITGNQFAEINTVFQLLSLAENRPQLLERADKMMLMPDLFNYMLSGVKSTEYSIASTTQLLDAKSKQWSDTIINALGLPRRILTEIVPSGSKIGKLQDDICAELQISSADVIAVAGHDTQSALVSIPTREEDYIFISCGTWSLFGTELSKPLINQNSFRLNMTNEGGYGGKTSFMKNIIGLWLIQECRRQWAMNGTKLSFEQLEEEAESSVPFLCFIDPDSPEFVPPGDMPQRIRDYCQRTNQPIPEGIGQVVRCINESLAFKYRETFDEIRKCTDKDYSTIYIVGGGVKSNLLCQMTANACHRRVSAGPVEATVYGNVLLQLITKNEIKGIDEAKEIVMNLPDITEFMPEDEDMWEQSYQKYLKIIKEQRIQPV